MSEDEFLEALTALEHTLADNQARATLIKKRIAQLRRLRSRGASYAEVVAIRDGPLIVQLLTESSKALDTSGANVRRAEAQALYEETAESVAARERAAAERRLGAPQAERGGGRPTKRERRRLDRQRGR